MGLNLVLVGGSAGGAAAILTVGIIISVVLIVIVVRMKKKVKSFPGMLGHYYDYICHHHPMHWLNKHNTDSLT